MKKIDFLEIDEFISGLVQQWNVSESKEKLALISMTVAAILSILALSEKFTEIGGLPKAVVVFYDNILSYIFSGIPSKISPAVKLYFSFIVVYMWIRSIVMRSIKYSLSKKGIERVEKYYREYLISTDKCDEEKVGTLVKLRIDRERSYDNTEEEIKERVWPRLSTQLIIILNALAMIIIGGPVVVYGYDLMLALWPLFFMLQIYFIVYFIRAGLNSNNPFMAIVYRQSSWEVISTIFLSYFVAKISVFYI